VSFNPTRDGSGGGFENVFIPGDSDMNNASRPIGEDELQRCRDNGIEPVEFFLAQDALTVVVNNEADFIDSIRWRTFGTIWSPDAAPETWADVNSDWPDEPFDLYGPAATRRAPTTTSPRRSSGRPKRISRSAAISREPRRTT